MKIIFDHQIFTWQRYGGVSKYFCEMISRLPHNSWDISLKYSNNEYIDALNLLKTRHFFKNRSFRGQDRILLEISKPYSAYRLFAGEYDIFHQTHFETYCLPFIGKKKMVTTFHDINFSTYNRNDKLVAKQVKSMDRADKVIAISHSTKRDLIDVLHVPKSKIEVVHHGVSAPLSSDLVAERIIKEEYILYVGRRDEYKNFKRLVSAFSFLIKDSNFKHIKLVCTNGKFSNEEIQYLKELGVWANVIHLACNEIQMANLYSYALLFVFPSFFEGFGMPILEAMSYNCPTIIANASCFPEIAGDASVYFDPFDIEDIHSKIVTCLEDSELRNVLIEKGNILCKKMTWEKSAQEHFSIYQSLL